MGSIKHIFTNAIADGTNTQIVRPSDWNSDHTYFLQDAVSLAGNTSGALANVSTGTLILAGGNNITLSQNGNSVTISGANVGGAQTGISSVIVSDATYTSGMISFSGENNITIGSSVNANTQYIRLSVGNYITTAMLSNAVTLSNVRVSAGTTSNLLSAITFADGSGVSWGINASTITASVKTDYLTSQSTQYLALTLGGNTAGTTTFNASNNATLFLNGGNNITLSGNGSTVTISAAAQTNQSAIRGFGASNTGNTAGNTGISTGVDWVLAGSTNITVSESTVGGGPNTLWLSVPNVAVAAESNNFNLLGANTAGNTTASGSTIGLSGVNLTLSGTNNSQIVLSVPATSSLSATGVVSIATNGSTISVGVGTFNLYASSNTTLTSSGTMDLRSVTVRGVGRASIGYSNAELVISVPAYSAGISNLGNTTGSTGMVDQRLVLVGSNAITLSGSTDAGLHSATVTIMGNPQISEFDPYRNPPVSNSSLGNGTVYFAPFDVPHEVSASRVNFFLSLTHTFSGAPNNSTAWIAAGYGIYTRMSGTGSDRISNLTSYSLSYVSGSVSSSTRLSVTNYIGLSNATSHSTSQYGVQNASVTDYLGSSIAGYRVLALPLNLTLTPNRYWMGFSVQSSSQGASFILGHSVLQNQYSNNLAYRVIGAVSAASNASVYHVTAGLGTYSATTAAFPVSIALTNSDIRGANVQTIPYFNFSGVSTSSNIL